MVQTSSKSHAALAAEVAELQATIVSHERAAYLAKQRINEIIDSAPATFTRKFRRCTVCHEWTTERWSANNHNGCECCRAQCVKHTKSKDQTSMAILHEAFYGD